MDKNDKNRRKIDTFCIMMRVGYLGHGLIIIIIESNTLDSIKIQLSKYKIHIIYLLFIEFPYESNNQRIEIVHKTRGEIESSYSYTI